MSSSDNVILEQLIDKLSSSIPLEGNLGHLHLDTVLESIEKFGLAVGENNRLGLQDICLLVQETFTDIIDSNGELDENQFELLKQWRILVSNYVKDGKFSTADALTRFFDYPQLNTSINSDELDIIRDLLEKEGNIFKRLFSDTIESLNNTQDINLSELNEKIDELSNTIDLDKFVGFQDICLMFQENISDMAEDNQTLNNNQKELVVKWLSHAEKYIEDVSNIDEVMSLVNILKDEHWPTPLDEMDANILFEMLGVETTEKNDDSVSPNQIPESLNTIFLELSDYVKNIDASNKQTMLSVADKTEEIGLAGGEIELFGFQDVCLIVKENLSDMLIDETNLSEDLIKHIGQWPTLLSSYLSNLKDKQSIEELLKFLTSSAWSNPLEENDLEVLKDMMLPQVDENDFMESTMVTTTDQFDSTIVTTNARLQEEFSEILDDVIETKDILAAPHTISKDLVEMLREEVVLIQEETQNCINNIQDENIDAEVISDSLSQYALHIERFGSACQAAEMDGLHQTSSVFANNLNHFANNATVLTEQQRGLLTAWPEKVMAYLQSPGDNVCSDNLVEIIKNEALPNNLMSGVAPALINLLKAVYVSDKDPARETRQKEARAEDVSIELPSDINQELLDGLLLELPGQTEAFSSAIQALIDGSGDLSEVQKAQRIAHTVKGAANTVGVKGIAILTHQLEDIMSALNELNHLPPPALATTFMDAADCLEEMSEALLERGSSPPQSIEVLQAVLDWANRIEIDGVACLASDQVHQTQTESKPDRDNEDNSAEENVPEATLRVPASLIDDVLRLLGETTIITSQLQERINTSTEQSQRLIDHQNMVQNLTSDLEVQVEVNSNVAFGQKQAVNQNEVFDSLELEEYNELHSVTHSIVEAAVDSYELNQEISDELRELDELLIEKTRLHNEIQELVMRTRMVPIKSIVPRLQRIVRQTCRTTKKQVALEINGSDTLIDSDILNNLIDPLMHMLRNAVDHGIEAREERIHLKKEPEGKILLEFSREGTQILVRCKDDGAGLNKESILQTGIKRNLVDEGTSLSDSDIYRLILNPGFSTREKATQTSGRGVGMDVVHTELLAMKGSVHIESEEGNGCLIELRMPVTLMSSHALLLRHLSQIIAVSNHGIEKILHPSDSQIIEKEDGLLCEVEGEQLQMVTLESLLNLPEDRRTDDRETRPALLIKEEELNHVIYIQEIVDTRDLFVKSMGKYLNNVKGVLGATILGDGSVVPVIDLPELLRAPIKRSDSPSELTQTNIHQALPVALVVDESLSARRALAQVIHDAGFDVRTAKDGLEAVSIIEKKIPDIILVDMEMPRMNGMELTSHIRGIENTKGIPVIMVTSRSTEKHRNQAKAAGVDVYVTKPFTEDDLLDHVHDLLDQS